MNGALERARGYAGLHQISITVAATHDATAPLDHLLSYRSEEGPTRLRSMTPTSMRTGWCSASSLIDTRHYAPDVRELVGDAAAPCCRAPPMRRHFASWRARRTAFGAENRSRGRDKRRSIWTPPACQQEPRSRDQNRMQTYIRPVLKPSRLLAMMGIRAPRATHVNATSWVIGVCGLARRRSDRSRHQRLPTAHLDG